MNTFYQVSQTTHARVTCFLYFRIWFYVLLLFTKPRYKENASCVVPIIVFLSLSFTMRFSAAIFERQRLSQPSGNHSKPDHIGCVFLSECLRMLLDLQKEIIYIYIYIYIHYYFIYIYNRLIRISEDLARVRHLRDTFFLRTLRQLKFCPNVVFDFM